MLDVKKIDRKYVEELANLFDKLESAARLIIGTGASPSKEEDEEEGEEKGYGKLWMFKELRPIFREIDSKIAEILGINVDVDALWDEAWEMMERRVGAAGRKVTPGVEGIELTTPTKRSRKGRRKRGSQGNVVPLTKWLEQGGEHNEKESS